MIILLRERFRYEHEFKMWQFIGFSHLFIGKIVMLLLLKQLDFELKDQRMISKQITMLPVRDKKNEIKEGETTFDFFSPHRDIFLPFSLSP